MEIRRSARRHGKRDEDIHWAVDHALAIADVVTNLEQDVVAVLYIGPDTNGDLTEVVVIEDDDGSEIAVHAMKLRKRYRRLLPKGKP